MHNPVVILRVSNDCNLRCKYCYDKSNQTAENKSYLLSDDNMDQVIYSLNKIFDYQKSDYNKIIFHGGEPLLVKQETYKTLLEALTKSYNNINYSIQTNGTLLNQQYIDLFNEYKVNIGLSLDGANEDQNKNRIYLNGHNSFYQCMSKINMLQSNKSKFGVIFTLSKANLNKERELYDFIANNNLYCNIRPAFPKKNIDTKDIMSPIEFANFFNNLFDIWYDDDKELVSLHQIKELVDELSKVLFRNYKVGDCSCSGNCFEYFLSLDVNGELYSCNRFYRNNQFYYGNINDLTMVDVMKKARELSVMHQKAINSRCKDCVIYSDCHGGCSANNYDWSGNVTGLDYFCESKLLINKHVKQKVLGGVL